MAQQDDSRDSSYPIGRGYGHDYMRGGEVLGGYGYSERDEYERRRGELEPDAADGTEEHESRESEERGARRS